MANAHTRSLANLVPLFTTPKNPPQKEITHSDKAKLTPWRDLYSGVFSCDTGSSANSDCLLKNSNCTCWSQHTVNIPVINATTQHVLKVWLMSVLKTHTFTAKRQLPPNRAFLSPIHTYRPKHSIPKGKSRTTDFTALTHSLNLT